MTFQLPFDPPTTGFEQNGNGVTIGDNGISGCVNIFGVEICGSLPLPGGPTAPSPEVPPTTGFSPIDCPEGTFWSPTLNRCVDPLAAFPGGDPLFFPGAPTGAAANGCPAIPKVQATKLVTPILWLTQYKCKPGTGYRPNKSAFWRADPARGGQVVRVGEGQAWVKGRRRNPSNMRATDRAASRVKMAKDAMQSLGRITVQTKAEYKAKRLAAGASRRRKK